MMNDDKVGAAMALAAARDAQLARGDPYGVPTGAVPRVGFVRVDDSMKINGNPLPPLQPDPVQQAVDDYLLMERKARAWDEVRRVMGAHPLLDEVWHAVHPAQLPAAAKS